MNKHLVAAVAGAGGLIAAAAAVPADAATITFDFTSSGGAVSGSGFTVTRTYSSGGITLTARGFSLSGNPLSFTNSQVGFFSGAGLGVCNQTEGTNCDPPNHQIDNAGRIDFILLQMAPAVTINSAVVETFSGADTDVSYFLGNAANPMNLNGVGLPGLAGLGFGSEQVDNGNGGFGATNTITIGAGPFNALLLGAQLGEDNDAFKLRTLTVDYTPVPEPLSLTLFGTGLLGLGLVTRRRREA